MKTTTTLLLALLTLFTACQTPKTFTKEERELILSAPADEPFRVLQTDVLEDSLLLRKASTDLQNYANDSVLLHLINRLESTMRATGGIGIAASQVGIRRNVFLFVRIDAPGMPVEVAINARIVEKSDSVVCFVHDGCLSVPDVRGGSARYSWIEVEYFNPQGEKISERLAGYTIPNFTNIIFQHEYDHTKGILFIDRPCTH
jgi:peptide deformylase